MKLSFIVILFFLGCKTSGKRTINAINIGSSDSSITSKLPSEGVLQSVKSDSVEKFDAFFERFKRDSVFQLSRIQFPLKNTLNSDDEKEIKTIDKKEWNYTNFMNIKKLILSKTSISRSRVSVMLQIEDTGVNVTYNFDRKEGLWTLTSIIDESD